MTWGYLILAAASPAAPGADDSCIFHDVTLKGIEAVNKDWRGSLLH